MNINQDQAILVAFLMIAKSLLFLILMTGATNELESLSKFLSYGFP